MKKNNCSSRGVQLLPRLSEEDLAKSAKAARQDRNRFGVMFREMQLETMQRIREREKSEEDERMQGKLVPRA